MFYRVLITRIYTECNTHGVKGKNNKQTLKTIFRTFKITNHESSG